MPVIGEVIKRDGDTTGDADSDSSNPGLGNHARVAIGVTIPTVALLAVLLGLVFMAERRRRANKKLEQAINPRPRMNSFIPPHMTGRTSRLNNLTADDSKVDVVRSQAPPPPPHPDHDTIYVHELEGDMCMYAKEVGTEKSTSSSRSASAQQSREKIPPTSQESQRPFAHAAAEEEEEEEEEERILVSPKLLPRHSSVDHIIIHNHDEPYDEDEQGERISAAEFIQSEYEAVTPEAQRAYHRRQQQPQPPQPQPQQQQPSSPTAIVDPLRFSRRNPYRKTPQALRTGPDSFQSRTQDLLHQDRFSRQASSRYSKPDQDFNFSEISELDHAEQRGVGGGGGDESPGGSEVSRSVHGGGGPRGLASLEEAEEAQAQARGGGVGNEGLSRGEGRWHGRSERGVKEEDEEEDGGVEEMVWRDCLESLGSERRLGERYEEMPRAF